jgi:hypothetical protein
MPNASFSLNPAGIMPAPAPFPLGRAFHLSTADYPAWPGGARPTRAGKFFSKRRGDAWWGRITVARRRLSASSARPPMDHSRQSQLFMIRHRPFPRRRLIQVTEATVIPGAGSAAVSVNSSAKCRSRVST